MRETINDVIENLKQIRMNLYPRSTVANRIGSLELALNKDIEALESVLYEGGVDNV